MAQSNVLTIAQTVAGPGTKVIDLDRGGRSFSTHSVHATFPASGGVGCVISQISSGGALTGAPTVVAGGSGYAVGDVLAVQGGDGTATVTVATLSGTAVATVTLTAAGTSGYVTGTNSTASNTPHANTGMSSLVVTLQGSLSDSSNFYDLGTVAATSSDLMQGSLFFSVVNRPAYAVKSLIKAFSPNGSANPTVTINYFNGGI